MYRLNIARVAKDIPPAIDKVRLSEVHDAPYILPLCTGPMKATFRVHRTQDIEELIKSSVISISQLNLDGDIIGFLAIRDHPLIPGVHPMVWEEYIWTKYKSPELNSRNTMWIHLICWNKRYARDVVEAMLQSVFMNDSYVHNIALVKSVISCPQLIPGTSRAEAAFRRVQSTDRGVPGDQLPAMLIAERADVCPRLRVRRAVEEDNDDIVPIIDRHSERLKEMYGDFYISELISRHPESERVLVVCEHKELAVGIMVLNTQINFESLEECFELGPFAGLRHLDGVPRRQRSCEVDVNSGIEVPVDEALNDSMSNFDTVSATGNYSKEDRAPSMQSRATWGDESQQPPPAPAVPLDDPSLLGAASLMEFLELFSFDEDDLDFEIINIEPEQMRVPYFMTSNAPSAKLPPEPWHKESTHEILAPVQTKEQKKSMVCPMPEYIFRYNGSPNAFLLEVCAMSDEYDERYAFDMLEAAFELFPGRDYCIISLPSSHAPFPLLEHFTMVTPHTTRMRFINESLYVAHVNSVKGDVSVRPAELVDEKQLVEVLEHAPQKEQLTAMFTQALRSQQHETFMLLAQKQPIGVVFVGPLENGVSIRTQFELEPESRGALTDGVIVGGVMSPTLEPHARWFMRDIMRQTRYSTLFWMCQPYAKGDLCPRRNMMSLVERLIPVRPRTLLPNISGDKLLDQIFENLANPFALWMIDKPLSIYPKVNVNNSIVVVGASRTGLAFIESLILGPTSRYLTFTNLTLVSEHGLPTVADCLPAASVAIPREGRYTDHYLKSVPFGFYVDVIPAVFAEIDRRKRCIYMKGGGVKYYDDLIITCGQQFQHPDYLKEFLERVQEVRKGKPCERMLMDDPQYQPDQVPPSPPMPENLFLVNSLLQANVVFRRLLKLLSENRETLTMKNRIVVYGDCIEAYSCIAALLELGLDGKEIAFIDSYPPEDFTAIRINCFNDEIIDEKVQDQMTDLGIEIYRNWRVTQLHVTHKRVTALTLMDSLHLLKINCYAMFYYGLKAIDIHAFKAINECGLVYDGGLVVGPQFETNDPNIYGAGTCCNYSRRLYAANHNHKYYNSEEVGEALAEIFLSQFDPFVRCHPRFRSIEFLPRYSSSLFRRSHASIPDVSPSRLHLTVPSSGRAWQTVIKYRKPISIAATLPGPVYYLKVRKPGPDIPMEVQLSLPHQGHTLLTNKSENYFRLRLNVLHCVNEITCLSRENFATEPLVTLYGKHEALFNKLLLRYQIGLIEDFYAYFMQPWMTAVYQETFDELLGNIYEQDIDMRRFTTAGVAEEDPTEPSAYSSAAGDGKKASRLLSCAELQTCQVLKQTQAKNEARTLHSIINKFAGAASAELERTKWPADIPTECGQNEEMRNEISEFWEQIGADHYIDRHIGRHVKKYCVLNPQYAAPKEEFYENENHDEDND